MLIINGFLFTTVKILPSGVEVYRSQTKSVVIKGILDTLSTNLGMYVKGVLSPRYDDAPASKFRIQAPGCLA